jgi:hypothetical protein
LSQELSWLINNGNITKSRFVHKISNPLSVREKIMCYGSPYLLMILIDLPYAVKMGNKEPPFALEDPDHFKKSSHLVWKMRKDDEDSSCKSSPT